MECIWYQKSLKDISWKKQQHQWKTFSVNLKVVDSAFLQFSKTKWINPFSEKYASFPKWAEDKLSDLDRKKYQLRSFLILIWLNLRFLTLTLTKPTAISG